MGFLSHLLLLLCLCTIPALSAEDPLGVYCNTNKNISNNQISTNIDRLLPQLVQGTILNGYIATSTGKAENQVYGLAQCRADVVGNDCKTCIQDAATEIQKRCPNQGDARIWYDFCFLRYDIKDFFGEADISYGILYANVASVTDPDTFFGNFCSNKKGCRVLYSSCYVRYELYPFYFPLDSQDKSANASLAYHMSVVTKT